jgi:hypothetical protein
MPRRGEACMGCHRRFAVDERFAVHLYEVDGGYERREYCEQCRPPAEPEPVAAWKTQRRAPAAKRAPAFDREAICAIFERLEDAVEPAQLRLRFVLALLLWRKKVLRLERTAATDGREVWEFVVVQTGAQHRVARPDLDEQQLEHLSAQLESLLASETREEQTHDDA